MKKKSWREKLEKKMAPKVVAVPDKWAKRIGHGRMLVPSPILIDKAIRKIRKGKLTTISLIREELAGKFQADMTCPLTTAIFTNITAHTAEEDKSKGKKRITPWWRVIKQDGSLNPKFPGGVRHQAKYLKEEGFKLTTGRRKDELIVKDFERKLQLD